MNPEDTYQSARNWSTLDDILYMKKKADNILIRKSHDREDNECDYGCECILMRKLLAEFYTACPDCGRELEDY